MPTLAIISLFIDRCVRKGTNFLPPPPSSLVPLRPVFSPDLTPINIHRLDEPNIRSIMHQKFYYWIQLRLILSPPQTDSNNSMRTLAIVLIIFLRPADKGPGHGCLPLHNISSGLTKSWAKLSKPHSRTFLLVPISRE